MGKRRNQAPLAGAVLAGLMAGAACAGEGIAVQAVGKVDPALVERAAGFLQSNLLVRVRVLPPAAPRADTFEAAAAAAAKLREPGDAFLVAFVAAPRTTAQAPDLLATNRTAAINVRALAAPDAERAGRRFERMAMRGLGSLLGLPLCPNPYCALTDRLTITNLDDAARNYCPPCSGAAERAVRAAGLARLPEGAPPAGK